MMYKNQLIESILIFLFIWENWVLLDDRTFNNQAFRYYYLM